MACLFLKQVLTLRSKFSRITFTRRHLTFETSTHAYLPITH